MLVTGASGFLGRAVAAELVARGLDVVGTYLHPEHAGRVPPGAEASPLDLTRRDAPEALRALGPFDGVFHLAAAGVSDQGCPQGVLHETNVEGCRRLVEGVQHPGLRRFVHFGTGYEYRRAQVPLDEGAALEGVNRYGASKLAGWRVLDDLRGRVGLPLVTLRPFGAYGPGEDPVRLVSSLIRAALDGRPLRLRHPTAVRDMTYVDDLARAAWLAWTAALEPGTVLNLGVGAPGAISLQDLAEQVALTCGRSPDLVEVAPDLERRPTATYFVAAPGRAVEVLAWSPEVDLKRGIAQTVEQVRREAEATP